MLLCGQQRLEPEFSYDFLFINNLFSFKLTWVDRTHFDAPENVYFSKIGWIIFEKSRWISCKGDFQCKFDVSLGEFGCK